MRRKKYSKKRTYKPKSNKMSRGHGGDINPLAITVAVIVLLYILFWFLFWVFIIVLVFVIFYGASWLNNEYYYSRSRYNKRNDYLPFITYGGAAIISLCIIFVALVNTGKLDNTFLSWGKEGSNYVTIGKTKQGQHEAQVNKEGITEKVVISQIPEGDVKRIAEIPGMIVSNSVDTIHNWFIQALKKIFTGN